MRAADTFPMTIGDRAEESRVFTAEDIAEYRDLSGDAGLRFGHGAEGVPGPLLAGMISDLLGTTLPGLGTMWMKQSMEFGETAPVGAQITASVRITRMVPAKGLVYLHSECRCDGEIVVSGRSLVMVPTLSERATE